MAQAVIRCKVQVASVTRNMDNQAEVESELVTLYPVTSGSEENKAWSKATPSGRIELLVTNGDAHGLIVRGRSFYLDFIPAE